MLSPAYDLICTRLHLNYSAIALKDGLFSNDYETESYTANAFDDFPVFGFRIGIAEKRVSQQLILFQKNYAFRMTG